MGKRLVIVESPTKARTLERFLGSDFVVESSIGHIRDLPASAAEIPEKYKKEDWARLGVDVDDDFKPLYVVQSGKKKKITELRKHLKSADELLLATDEDREGEAISWHLVEVLKPKVPVRRMVFHEITRDAILESLEQTREIDRNLVDAQEARRIIDRLYGYSVSPVLWRKIAPRLSAGRVQSVAIWMLVNRERARMRFKPAEYWDLTAEFTTGAGESFEARLREVDGIRVAVGKDFDPDTGQLKEGLSRYAPGGDGATDASGTTDGNGSGNGSGGTDAERAAAARSDLRTVLDREAAATLREELTGAEFRVLSVEETPFTRSPAAPFTTSTMQQEANRKLRFDARRTMRAAQKLYETGLITYMRTDSVTLSAEAIALTRSGIEARYGADFLPPEPRVYRTKVKNAQEAHEAIRPAGSRFLEAAEVRRQCGEDEARLYDMIRKRTMASQMKDAVGRRVTAMIGSQGTEHEAVFRASGSVLDFPGFLSAYVEGRQNRAAALAEHENLLPKLQEREPLHGTLTADDHYTSPPPRLTEAGLIRALEESGIGRPSTYASIIDTIQRREYTFKKGSALVPTFTAFAVVQLMESHLGHLIDPEFTARMENRLDMISRGEREPLPYLREFYLGNGTIGLKKLLATKTEDIDARTVCTVPIGSDDQGREIVVRVGRYGPFLQRDELTAPVPDSTCPDEVTVENATELLAHRERGEEPIGNDPESGLPVYIKVGRYGPFVQLGDVDPDSKEKPKRSSLLEGMQAEEVSLDVALQLLALPRTLGQDADGVDVVVHNGRYGPYIKRGDDTRSLEDGDDLLTIGLPRAMELLAQEKKGRGFRRKPKQIKVFEKVEALGGVDIKMLDGRYGPYVTDGEVNASLPKGTANPEALSLEDALDLLERRRQAKPRRKKKAKKKKAKKKTAKKKASKKKAAKKTGKKKAAPKSS